MKKKATTPIFEKVPLSNKASFLFKKESFPYFDIPWHHHPEYEITLINKGDGEIVIGNSITHFKAGDLIFVGPNLPHLWKSDKEEPKKNQSEQLVLQFSHDFMGREFFDKFEFQGICKILEKAELGLIFHGKTRSVVATKMDEMLKAKDLRRLILLFEILEIMTSSNEYKTVASPGFRTGYMVYDKDRMKKIYDYTLTNFQKNITTHMVAELANMEISSFCRYFKIRTKKTYVQFLNEVRLGHACKLLLENVQSVNQICYACGFKNISNFHRQFKALTGKTPKEYRKSLF